MLDIRFSFKTNLFWYIQMFNFFLQTNKRTTKKKYQNNRLIDLYFFFFSRGSSSCLSSLSTLIIFFLSISIVFFFYLYTHTHTLSHFRFHFEDGSTIAWVKTQQQFTEHRGETIQKLLFYLLWTNKPLFNGTSSSFSSVFYFQNDLKY